MDETALSFADLFDIDELESLLEDFTAATGFPIGLLDKSTKEVLITKGWRDICLKFHRACPESAENCKASNKKLTSGECRAGELRIDHCLNGLVDGCTPIIIEEKHVADLFTGQVLFAPPDKEQFIKRAKQYGYDEQSYLKSLSEVPVVSEEKFRAMLSFMTTVATTLASRRLADLKSRDEATRKEALLQSVFKSAPIGIGLVVDRVFQWTNERLTEITGYSNAELTGQSARMLYPSQEEYEWVGQEKYKQIVEHGTGSVDTRFKRKDGSIIDVHLSSTPIDPADLHGKVAFTVLDITERQKALAAIADREERLDLALEGADLGMWDWNLQTDTVYFSPRYLSMLGYGPEELPHTLETWKNLLHPEDRDRATEEIKSCFEKIPPKWSIEFRLRNKEGRYVWILGRGKVVEFSKDGSPLRAAGTHLDITEAKASEQALIKSEERFRELYESAPLPYQSLDYNGHFLEVNQAWLDTLGYSRDEVIGRSFGDFLLPEWKKHFKTNFPRFKDKGEILGVEFEMIKKNGEVILVHFNGRIAYDDQGNFQQTRCIFQDITKHRESEEQVRRSREEWEKTFNAIPDIITIQDKNMYIVQANQAASDLFGIENGNIIGKTCYQLFRNSDQPCPGCPELNTLTTAQCHSEIIEHPQLSKVFHVSSAPILDENKEVEFLVHIAKDITEQKKMEEELFQAHKMEAVGTLAGGIAHDFNNILSAIIGFTELAKINLDEGSDAAKDLTEVLKASERAAGLVRQILTFSRKGPQQNVPLRPYLVIKEALKLMRASLPTTLTIEEDIDTESGSILGDPTKIHQVIVNLCTNALHAMEDETGTLKITLAKRFLTSSDVAGHPGLSPGPFVELSVADTGCGIDEQHQQRIFEPYFSTKQKEKGTGLGLSVVLGIVEGCGGMIRVESQPGEGSIFHVYFPVVEDEEVDRFKDSTREAPRPTGTERVLLVDDEDAIIDLQKAVLSHLGYQVTAKKSSEEVLNLFKEDPQAFDILITDQAMPNLSGAKLAEQVLSIRPDMPIILCTGYSATFSEKEALELGIKKYLDKPVDNAKLARIVRQVLDEG